MNEVLAVPCLLNHVPANIIDLPAVDRAALRERVLHVISRGVAGISDDVEDLCDFVGYLVADERSPGDVRVDRVRSSEFGPQVYQHEDALVDRRVMLRG